MWVGHLAAGDPSQRGSAAGLVLGVKDEESGGGDAGIEKLKKKFPQYYMYTV